jgi:hypothetical protein
VSRELAASRLDEEKPELGDGEGVLLTVGGDHCLIVGGAWQAYGVRL